MTVVRSFDEALERSKGCKKRHLLLGNGFSIACRPNIFTYASLFEQADFSSIPRLPAVFDAVGSRDFERVIKVLEAASRITPIYSSGGLEAAAQMGADAEALKDVLIRTVAGNHPRIPNEIGDAQFVACRKFLGHFLGDENKEGKVYTLNYDLLLYWTLMHEELSSECPVNLAKNDGFGRDEDTEAEYVNWMGEIGVRGQRVHYLHGALHLFDAGAELQKYTWVNTGRPLIEQARAAMSANKFPLFVAEGESRQKLEKIKHSAYLHHSYKSFTAQMTQQNDALFVFGHSLAESDHHILKRIARGKIASVFISLYGDPDSPENTQVQKSAKALASARSNGVPLDIVFFDASSAKVWGD